MTMKLNYSKCVIIETQIERIRSEKSMKYRPIIKDNSNKINTDKLVIQSEKFKEYDDILNNQTELIVRTTMDHAYLFVNDSYCDYFGIKREALIGKKKFSHIFEQDHEKIEEALRLATIDNPFINVEMRGFKCGTLSWIEWTGCILYNESGEPVAYQGVGRDITERKKMEAKLKALQNELETKIGKRTLALKKANKEVNVLNAYMNHSLMNRSEGVAILDELGNFKNINNFLKKNWGLYSKEIKVHFKKMIVEGKNNDIHKMLKEKKDFSGCKLMIPTSKGNLQILLSGEPIDKSEDNVNRGIIIFTLSKEAHEILNPVNDVQARFTFDDIITKNKKMVKTIELASRASLGNGNILIQGDSGTGKELFAQAIHNQSKRCKGPFIAVNCSAIPSELIASELFGYTEGSFTGAKRGGKQGKFELASGGTIFLDEIGDMPLEQQVAILRVIQEKKITPIGGEQEIPIDMRIICATNKNLFEAMKNGNFREDLYYRLNVISIRIPLLRERREDILLLFEYFIKQIAKNADKILENIDPLVIAYLTKYDWYGNVRELQNVVERIVHIVQDDYIKIADLPEYILQFCSNDMDETASMLPKKINIKHIAEKKRKIKEERECSEILRLFKECKGNITQIAREMKISRSTLYRKIDRYKIDKNI